MSTDDVTGRLVGASADARVVPGELNSLPAEHRLENRLGDVRLESLPARVPLGGIARIDRDRGADRGDRGSGRGIGRVVRRRPRRDVRGLRELDLVATAYTEQAAARSEQRDTLTRTSQRIEEVARRLRRQSEEQMLDGLQGDPARVAYLTLALHLMDTADAMESTVQGLDLAETAMREAHEEYQRIQGTQLAPGHRAVLALGEPVAIPGVGTLAPADAQAFWLNEVEQTKKSQAQQAMDRFDAAMSRATSLVRTVEPPALPHTTRLEEERRIIAEVPRVVVDPQAAPDAVAVEDAPAGVPAPGGGAAAGAAAAAGGAARFLGGRSGGGYAGRAAAGPAAPAWVSTRAQHDTGPDGSMAPAAPAQAPVAGASGQGAGEEESGTAIVRAGTEEAAAIVAASSTAGSRAAIEQAPAESDDW